MDAVMEKLQALHLRDNSRPVVLVGVFEDAATEARVLWFCLNLSRVLGAEREVTKQMWLLSELRVARLRTIAAAEAAQADLVVIALHHGDELPAEVEDWAELWLKPQEHRQNRHPVLLYALFDPLYQGASSSMQARLKEAARRGHLEFLAESAEPVGEI